MTALSNRTYTPDHTLYKSVNIGRELHVVVDATKGNVVKDFKIGNTRIKICDDYCYNKTPEIVQTILDRIAHRAGQQLAIQQHHQNTKLNEKQ